ncbi:hypothetical protein M011DRAFT_411005, partial [Sporormia fimetaria CBS 119925]
IPVKVRAIGEGDVGIRVLRETRQKAQHPLDIIAIHGIGAHPDNTWTRKNEESGQYINWLCEDSMLPAIVGEVRIMRYGYTSAWFGENSMKTRVRDIATRLLDSLTDAREECPERPLIFIAHCFGGLVTMEAALREYPADQVCIDSLSILQGGNETLGYLVDDFCRYYRDERRLRIACFYETGLSNVGSIVGGRDSHVSEEHIASGMALNST